jgi:aryl-alcohol dehydrogenase-like predicted oxidoreductase
VPARAQTYGATERIIGNWFARTPGARNKVVLATKVAGPARGMDWIRNGSPDLSAQDIVAACDASLQRLQTDVIDLYQIHWPVRHVPAFGNLHFDPAKDTAGTSLLTQLEALGSLVKAGKVRAVGLSNETPYGVHEFVRLAEVHKLPRIATVQNAYCLSNRSVENGLDETMFRLGVSLLAYSPLGFGLLTGKYDATGLDHADAPRGRMSLFESMKKQRFGRPASIAAARRYNVLARDHGLTPTQLALAFCQTKWQVTSTLLGVTTLAQLDENLDTLGLKLSTEVLAAIDAIRWDIRDPAV